MNNASMRVGSCRGGLLPVLFNWGTLDVFQANQQGCMSMNFEQLLAAVRQEGSVIIPFSWAQGRATFGGVVAALVFDVMAGKVAEGRAMRDRKSTRLNSSHVRIS